MGKKKGLVKSGALHVLWISILLAKGDVTCKIVSDSDFRANGARILGYNFKIKWNFGVV